MLLEELQQLSTITQGKQREYFEAMLRDARVVRCKPMKEILPEHLVKRIKDTVKIKKKQCYRNATLIAQLDPDIRYVEGKFEFLGISIEHAWNEYKGSFFDVTSEVALKENPGDREYLALDVYTFDEVMDVILKSEVYGGIYQAKFLQTKYKK